MQAQLKFTNMRVPKENILSKPGRGLKLALSILNFGRTTFGATCTGAAKVCVAAAARHANTRKQFGQTLAISHPLSKAFALTGEIWRFTQPFQHDPGARR